jgi:hypothetical protein
MRTFGVRSLDVTASIAVTISGSTSTATGSVPVPAFGPRMVCTRCGIVGADARPNWTELPPRSSLIGVQWRLTAVWNGDRQQAVPTGQPSLVELKSLGLEDSDPAWRGHCCGLE